MSAELALLQQIKNKSFGYKRSAIFPAGTKTFESLGKMFKNTKNVANASFGGDFANATLLHNSNYSYTVPMQSIVIGNYMYIVVGSSDPTIAAIQVLTVSLATMEIINTQNITVNPQSQVYIVASKTGTEFSIVYVGGLILGKTKATINQTTYIPTFVHINKYLPNAPTILFCGYLNNDLIIVYYDSTPDTTYLCINTVLYSNSTPEKNTGNINGYIIDNALILGNYSITANGGVIAKTLVTPVLTNVICLGYKTDGNFYYVKSGQIYLYNIADSTSTKIDNGSGMPTNVYYVAPMFPSNGFIQSYNNFNYIINTETDDCAVNAYAYYKYADVGNMAVAIAFNTVTGKVIQYHKYTQSNYSLMYSTARIDPAFFESIGEGVYLQGTNYSTSKYYVTAGDTPTNTSGYKRYLIATPICALFGGGITVTGSTVGVYNNGLYATLIMGTVASAAVLNVNLEG